MVAAAHCSHTLAESRNRFFTSMFDHTFSNSSRLRFSLRYFSTQHTMNADDESDKSDEHDQKSKPKSRSKTKRARSMARLINTADWSVDLESSLSSLSPAPPSKTTVLQTLRLITTPSKALRFFIWVQHNGFSHNDQSYFAILEILGRSRNLNAARNLLFSIEKKSGGAVKLEDRFFNSLIRSYGHAGLFQESIKVFSTMKQIGVSPSVITFNSLLSILLKRGRTNMAKHLYDEMLNTYGVTPDTYTFNILIRGFCMNSMVDEGFHFFKEMASHKCEPDVITYNTLMDGLCRAGKIKIAHNVLKGMWKGSSTVSPNIVTYTTLVRGYCMKQDIDEAVSVYKEMVSRGLKPNRITYNTLIQGLSEAQKLDKIKEILEGTMGFGEFVPDTCTINTLMNAHCNAGNLDEAVKVFEKMSELRAQPDSATYSILIRNFCEGGNYERAELLFDELSEKGILQSNVGCKPLVAAYNSIFTYLCQNGKTKKAEIVFRQLMKRGTQDPPSYKTLIIGHCREGSAEAGYELLVLMLRRNFVPDVEVYISLIEGLLRLNKPVLAYRTLEKMLKSKHLPEASIFHYVLAQLLESGCARESATTIMLMLDRKIRQNINLSTDTIMLLFRGRFCGEAFETLRSLHENGYSVKVEKLIGFLFQSKMLVEAHEILLFCLEKQQSVDVDMCSAVISGLCKVHKVSAAFNLFYELLEKGMQQQLACLEELRAALESEGRSKEVQFMNKRMLNQWQ